MILHSTTSEGSHPDHILRQLNAGIFLKFLVKMPIGPYTSIEPSFGHKAAQKQVAASAYKNEISIN